MKRLLLIFTLSLFAITLAACADEKPIEDKGDTAETLDIYDLNDLHGAITPSGDAMGMAYIGNFLLYHKQENPESTLILAGGDMLQGSALSNYYHGESVVELMNATKFDALAIGNHEFDWGLETVTDYFEPETGIADFPLLGANVHYKGTDDIPENIDPYTILERGDLRIGVIGTIGYGLESSIATRFVEDYEFKRPGPIVEDYSRYLRQDEDVDIVLLLTHDVGDVNSDVAMFPEDARIDAIFNGHSHQTFARYENGVPAIQSGAYGEHVGHVELTIEDKQVADSHMRNLNRYGSSLLRAPHPDVEALIESYVLETDEIFSEEIVMPERSFSRGELTDWTAELVRVAMNADIGSQNYGGTRQPIDGNEPITISTLYDVWPFDNAVVAGEMTGDIINEYVENNDGNSHPGITTFEDEEIYTFVANDYIFYHTRNRFADEGENIRELPYYIRELVEHEMRLQNEVYDTFDVNNDILTTPYDGEEDWPVDEVEE